MKMPQIKAIWNITNSGTVHLSFTFPTVVQIELSSIFFLNHSNFSIYVILNVDCELLVFIPTL